MTVELPPFDNSRSALAFALNASEVAPPGPQMNRMMAEVKVQEKKRKRKTPIGEVALLQAIFGGKTAEELLEEERALARNKTRRDMGNKPLPMRGLDRAHQAGVILHYFSKLDHAHRVVLTGRLTHPYVVCECRRPCCSGRMPVMQWLVAVRDACRLLEHAEVLEKVPGKKGFSTTPRLRHLVIENEFGGRNDTLQDIATECRMALTTVARHKEWIAEYVARVETVAWKQVDALFDGVGITGAWN